MYPSHRSPIVSEKVNELMEQLKAEYANIENELNVSKMQRDDYERKLEAQLNEFNNIKQTIIDLEVNFQNMKQHYEEEILRLRRRIEELGGGSSKQTTMNGGNSSEQRQQGPPNKKMRTETGSEPFYQTPPSHASPSSLLTDSKLKSTGVPPFRELDPSKKLPQQLPTQLPTQIGNLPTQIGAVSNLTQGNTQGVPTTLLPTSTLSPQQIPPLGKPMSSDAVAIIKTSNKPNDLTNASPLSPQTKSGNDWVVVYNPQVKSNVNINLYHNLDHHSVVCCVKFSNDGKYLATGCNKFAQIFNVETGQKIRTLPAESSGKSGKTKSNKTQAQGSPGEKEDSYVRSVCFSPDGTYLVAGAEDKTVKVWNIKTGVQKHSFVGHELDIYSLDFSSDNRLIVSGSGDGKARIWNMETGKCDHILGNEDVGPKEGVTSVAISPDGRVVAAGSLDCVVRLWDAQTGRFLESFKGHEDSVYSVAFSPDGKTLASGSLDKTLKLWDLVGNRSGYRCIATLTGHRDYVLSVAFSPDGKWLISGSKDRSVQFWDPRSNVLHLMLQGHKNSVISVAVNPKSQMFATGSGDYRARIWKFDSTFNG